MIHLTKKRDCCGCTACANACPVNCITMQPDEEGFLYPQIDSSACIACGKCEKACPIPKQKPVKSPPPVAFAARNRNEEIRMNSTSGGIFSLLASRVLEENGTVYGAAYDDDFRVGHIAIEAREDLWKLRGSKYVQSDLNDCFSRAKADLEANRKVLFSGTPCQIAGLLSYLGKSYPNLITVDLICHGTPSPAVWKEYVAYRAETANSQIKEIAFRKKSGQGTPPSFFIKFENGSEYVRTPYLRDPMVKLFLFNKCLRPSCHHCAFKGVRRADITIADLWSVNSVARDMNDGNGVSLMLIHTAKGFDVLNEIRENTDCRQIPFKRAIKKNPAYFHSTLPSPVRKAFFTDFRKKPFKKVIRRHRHLL